MRTLAATICAATLVLHAGVAFAQAEQRARPDQGPTSVMVSYADLDLDDPAGRETLNRRIDAAVRRVCSDAEGGGHRRSPARDCLAAVRADADRQLIARGRDHHAHGAIQVRAPH